MKRILTFILVIILLLSCCPNVFASAEGTAKGGFGFSEMNPKIKEILNSQISQEERDTLVALDPSLEDALLLKVFSFLSVTESENPIEHISSVVKRTSISGLYIHLSDTPESITFRKESDSGIGVVKRGLGNDCRFIKDIMQLGSQIKINGKYEDIINISCFGRIDSLIECHGGLLVCIITEAGMLFKNYDSPYSDPTSEAIVLSERKMLKYIDDYLWCLKVKDSSYGKYYYSFYPFLENYVYYMAEASTKVSKQFMSTYGLTALGVVLVAGVAAVGVVLYRRRRKAVLPIEVVADPVDDP